MGLPSTGVLLGTIAVMVAIAWVHRYWLGQALKRIQFDRDLAIYYEKPIRILATIWGHHTVFC